jgi:hypothetical protein
LPGAPIEGPGEVAVEVRGWLRDLLPEQAYEPFRVRTAAEALPG